MPGIMRGPRSTFGRVRPAWTAVLCFAFLSSCEGTTVVRSVGPPALLEIVAGQNQTAPAGTELPVPIEVRVLDADGQAVAGQVINFKVVAGGGSVFAGTAISNASGIAKERWTVGTTVSEQRLEARAVDPVNGAALVLGVFNATVTPAAPSAIAVAAGTGQTGVVATPLTDSIAARVVDQFGNGVPAVSVAWTAANGGSVTPATSMTGADGVARTGWTLGQIAGSQSASASVAGVATGSTFTASAAAGPPTQLTILTGDAQVAMVGAQLAVPISVRIRDAYNNPVGGVSVSFAVTSGGGAVYGPNAVSDASGTATVGAWTLGTTEGINSLSATISGVPTSTISITATAEVFKLASLSMGYMHVCGARGDGVAFCWGRNNLGQLGTNAIGTDRSVPTPVSGGLSFKSVSVGWEFTCGVTTAGAGYCWGLNDKGQVGDGSTTNRAAPVAVGSGLAFQSISAGESHACGLTTTGAVYCWGSNAAGRLGDGTTTNRLVPVAVSGGLTFTALKTGFSHTCAVAASGLGYCWGSNNDLTLGDFDLALSKSSPAPVGGVLLASITGTNHRCGLEASTGFAYCWGQNNSGQLGDGTSVTRLVAQPVSGGISFQTIAAQGPATCAIDASGVGYCWGGASLGNGSATMSKTPAAVAGALRFKALSPAGPNTCGLTLTGAVYCWGLDNRYGQLGQGGTSTGVQLTPVPVKTP